VPLATDTISSPHPPSTYLPNPYARNKNPQIIISPISMPSNKVVSSRSTCYSLFASRQQLLRLISSFEPL
jgi:hypothetical protein